MRYFILGIIFILVILWAFWRGWVVAHLTVADECKKLGKFYVGKDVFECVKIEERAAKDE